MHLCVYIYIYVCIYIIYIFFFRFFSIVGYCTLLNIVLCATQWASQVALMVKTLPSNAGNIRDTDSIPGLGRLPWKRARSTHFSVLAQIMDPGGPWSLGLQRVRQD